MIDQLHAERIDTRAVRRTPFRTDLSIVTVDSVGENTIVTSNLAAASFRPDPSAFREAVQAGDWVALQGNLSAEVTADVLRTARRDGCGTLLNPGPVQFDCIPMLADVDLLVVNRVEASTLTAQHDAVLAATALRHAGARQVCVTLGADGLVWCDAQGARQLDAVQADAVDTVGAGDAFCGTLLAALAQRRPLPVAVRWAQAVAAYSVARPGAQASFPDRATMRDLLDASGKQADPPRISHPPPSSEAP